MRLDDLTVCIVSHDAGGAELLASYVAHNKLNCFYSISGPAISIFERKIDGLRSVSLYEAITKSDLVLCGTSWQSDLEWQAILLAKKMNKHSIAYLDHWANYKSRFIRCGEEHLPDEIWVGDHLALSMAGNEFPGVTINLVPNLYLLGAKDQIAKLDSGKLQIPLDKKIINILFVCEPLSEHGALEFNNEYHWGYTEHDALRYFFNNIHSIFKENNIRVTVRPHPSELRQKYDWVTLEFPDYAVIGGIKTLMEEISDSSVVVGCDSMALIVGLISGRRVISCIPPGGRPCSLPHQNIENIQMLLRDC